jgi:hypothetical protein
VSDRPTDISIDLETLGNRSDAPILSIGATAFNRHTGKLSATYYTLVDMDDALRHGRIRASTLKWWMQQDDAARTYVFGSKPNLEPVSLYEALRGLNDYVRAQPANVCVWGNGSSFDISILEHAFDSVADTSHLGFGEEWKFWSVRDMRTIVDAADLGKGAIPFEGTAHHAGDDSRHQAKVIAKCLQVINNWRGGQSVKSVPVRQAVTADGEDW